MANEEHVAILKQGIGAWNEWREANPGIRPDFARAELHGINLDVSGGEGLPLTGFNLNHADFTRADLGMCNLDNTLLIGANLKQAFLKDATIRGAFLIDASLEGAALQNAHVKQTALHQTNFTDAFMGATTFVDVDLSLAVGLDTIFHGTPSYIDIHTIYRSKGQIPEAFLRGCGLPDSFIIFARSLALSERPIDYYSCFISYSSKDEGFAQRLHADLQDSGVRCWFAPEDMKIGDRIRQRIDESIRIHDKLLLVLSDNSIDSQWVEKEVETAWEEEARRGETVLFPVRLDESVFETHQAWAADIRRQRHIGDFREWKSHNSYQEALERLLRDLKAAS